MMGPLLLLAALAGHAFLWIGLVNRLHALGIRRRLVSLLTTAFFVAAATLPVAIGAYSFEIGQGSFVAGWRRPVFDGGLLPTLVAAYLVVCWIAAGATLIRYLWFLYLHRVPTCVRFHGRRAAIARKAAASDSGASSHHFLARLPLNEIMRLEISDWVIEIPGLPAALEGLSIVHMSDFHFTGRVGKAFFCEVVNTSNSLQPDLVALTGDLVDAAACIDWIPDTLGKLTARHGVYYVLGNHDLRTRQVARLRQTLVGCGLVDLGNRTRQIEIGGCPVSLTGDERPWIRGDNSACEPAAEGASRPLRIMLSHTPDRLSAARKQSIDLMLAGHTHGGQIRIPPLGPIFSPSLWGVKYISGIYQRPPTILHVTRGISAGTPVRWLCPPEIARIRLRKTTGTASSAEASRETMNSQ